MSWLGVMLGAALAAAGCSGTTPPPPEQPARRAQNEPSTDAVSKRALALETMKRATEFMVDHASTRGGYVWSYLGDLSRRWGEMEAYETMIWVQPPGTATVGHVLLDAYRVTGDEYYYEAAAKAGEALITGQLPSGGWNYMIDFAGEASLRRWYDTIGKNGWRLEEFHDYYGNGTFDDGGTAESTRFLLRLYLEKRDAKYRSAVDKALGFVLDSQYENGCWPQRYPMTKEYVAQGQPDYPADFTFNDDVAAKNIDVLLMYERAFGDEKLLERVRRAMDCFLLLAHAPPQAGWSLQYGLDRKPAAARSHEPVALSTTTTEENVAELLNFYALTGDAKYLGPIPAALAWLDSVRMPATPEGRPGGYPALIAVGSNRPLFVHRRGSNVTNGKYYVDDDPKKTIVHSRQIRRLDVEGLRARTLELESRPAPEVTRGSPFLASPESKGGQALPRFFTGLELPMSDMTHREAPAERVSPELVLRLSEELDRAGYWPTKLERISHPYRGTGPREVAPGDFSETEVGDDYDTSPYRSDDAPLGISTRVYVRNMFLLIRFLDGS
jgi:hypothetical protein